MPDPTPDPTPAPNPSPGAPPSSPTPAPAPTPSPAPAVPGISQPPSAPSPTPAPAAPPAVEVKVPANLPPGYDAAKVVESIKALDGMSSKLAQSLLEKDIAYTTAALESRARQLSTWDAAIKADPKFGADLARTQQLAAEGLEALGGKDLQGSEVLRHPAVLKALAIVGESIREDRIGGASLQTGIGAPTEDEKLRAMFPSMFNEDGTPKWTGQPNRNGS